MMDSGCDDFIFKPIKEFIILEKIEEHLGVRFIYEDKYLDKTDNEIKERKIISHRDFTQLPAEWKTEMIRAAESLDQDSLIRLNKQIEVTHPDLTAVISNWIDKFEYYKIIELIS